MDDREAYVVFNNGVDEALKRTVSQALAADPALEAKRDGRGVVLKGTEADR